MFYVYSLCLLPLARSHQRRYSPSIISGVQKDVLAMNLFIMGCPHHARHDGQVDAITQATIHGVIGSVGASARTEVASSSARYTERLAEIEKIEFPAS